MMIPIQAEYYALEGLGQLLETVEMVRAHLNPELAVSTILVTMYDARTRLASGVADEVREHFGDQVLRTSIPRSVRVSEAPSYGQTVMTYDPGSPGALCYLEAAREIAVRESPHEGPTAASRPRPRAGLAHPDRPPTSRGDRQTAATEAPASGRSRRRWPVAYFAELPIEQIVPNAVQPRQVFDEEAMAELVHSIREVGLLQPVVVRRDGRATTSW